jgi:hypothetical protein
VIDKQALWPRRHAVISPANQRRLGCLTDSAFSAAAVQRQLRGLHEARAVLHFAEIPAFADQLHAAAGGLVDRRRQALHRRARLVAHQIDTEGVHAVEPDGACLHGRRRRLQDGGEGGRIAGLQRNGGLRGAGRAEESEECGATDRWDHGCDFTGTVGCRSRHPGHEKARSRKRACVAVERRLTP